MGYVQIMDQDEAVEEFEPTIIICSWMPAQDWPSEWRQYDFVRFFPQYREFRNQLIFIFYPNIGERIHSAWRSHFWY